MAPPAVDIESRKSVERVRHELLTALNLGKLTPGDRVPSVRRLADLTGMNRKTIHRAYRRLAGEGLLDLRPGSGTFLAESLSGRQSQPHIGRLLLAANRCRAAAESLGLRPDRFAAFLQTYLGTGLRDLRLVVAECNREQLAWIDLELRSLGVDTRPLRLADFLRDPAPHLHDSCGVITTDCHRQEVEESVAARGTRVYRVVLDPRFPEELVEHAREAPVIMVIGDLDFVPVFRRLLRELSVPPELLERFRFVEPAGAGRMLNSLQGPAFVHVSPLVHRGALEIGSTSRFHRLKMRWRIEPGSLDRLRARLALDLVSGEGGARNRRAIAD